MAGRKLTAKDFRTFKKLLEEERARLLEELKKIEKEKQTLRFEKNLGDDPSSGEEEASDMGQQVTEIERLNAVQAHVAGMLRKVESAKKKIAAKTYGICEGCQKPIEKARLRALPFAQFCIRCQQQNERGRRQRI